MYYRPLLIVLLSLSIKGSYPETLTHLLDKIHTAQTYWESMLQNKTKKIWVRHPHTWFSSTWLFEAKSHQKVLAQQETELIELLATYADTHRNPSPQQMRAIEKKYTKTLVHHGVPSHFNRQWLSYTALAGSGIIAALYFHHYSQNHILFVLDPHSRSISSTLRDSPPVLGCDYVNHKGQQYLQVKKEQEKLTHDFLKRNNISYKTGSGQLSLSWYNEAGETKVREFIYKHGVQPIQEIFKILKNESPSHLPILSTDIDHDKALFEQRLVSVIMHAAQVKETAPLVEGYLQGRAIDSLPFPEKRKIFTALSFHLAEIAPTEIRNFIKAFSESASSIEKNLPLPALEKLKKIKFSPLPTIKPIPSPTHLASPSPLPILATIAPLTRHTSSPPIGSFSPSADPSLNIYAQVSGNIEALTQNGILMAEKGQHLLNSFQDLLPLFQEHASALKQNALPAANKVAAAVPDIAQGVEILKGNQPSPYPRPESMPPLEQRLFTPASVTNFNRTLINGNDFMRRMMELSNVAEGVLLPPLISTVTTTGKLAATLDQTAAHINATTLPEVDKLLKLVNESAPSIIKHTNHALDSTNKILDTVNETAPQVQALVEKTNDFIDTAVPPLTELLQNSNTIAGTVSSMFEYLRNMSKEHPDLGALFVEIIIVRALQLNLQAAAGVHEAGQMTERLKLNMEISATIPLMLAGFVLYKTTGSLYTWATVTPLINSLKRDLIALQLLCNKERYARNSATLASRYKGLVLYWTTRLHRYKESLPLKEQASYRSYLELLESKELSPEQKITTIECMFRSYSDLLES